MSTRISEQTQLIIEYARQGLKPYFIVAKLKEEHNLEVTYNAIILTLSRNRDTLYTPEQALEVVKLFDQIKYEIDTGERSNSIMIGNSKDRQYYFKGNVATHLVISEIAKKMYLDNTTIRTILKRNSRIDERSETLPVISDREYDVRCNECYGTYKARLDIDSVCNYCGSVRKVRDADSASR